MYSIINELNFYRSILESKFKVVWSVSFKIKWIYLMTKRLDSGIYLYSRKNIKLLSWERLTKNLPLLLWAVADYVRNSEFT